MGRILSIHVGLLYTYVTKLRPRIRSGFKKIMCCSVPLLVAKTIEGYIR